MSKSRQNAQRLVLKINSKKIRYANWDFKISLEEAKQNGIKQGSINKSIEIAKKMFEEKIPVETIMKITSLSKEEIEKLK